MKIRDKYKCTLLLGGLLWGLCSCSDSLPTDEIRSGRPELEINLSPGIDTRTILPGAENVQHVTRVSLYVFRHDVPGDTLGAKLCMEIPFDGVNWQQDLEEASSGGVTTRSQIVSLPRELSEDSVYTFLAVGSDETYTAQDGFQGDNATKAYGLHRLSEGKTTLEDFKAELVPAGKPEDIHVSELFSGTLTLKGSDLGKGKPRPTVHLFRRVAGVKGYFKRIPRSVRLNDGDHEVASLRVVYWKKQSEAVHLRPVIDWENHSFVDFINPEPDQCLVPEVGEVFVPDDLEKCSYFILPADSFPEEIPADSSQSETYATAGSYVLPAQGAIPDYTTLYVLLVDRDNKVLVKRKVLYASSMTRKGRATSSDGITDGGTGIIIGQPGDSTAQDQEYRYPIIANHYYSIGTPQEPIDMSNGDTDIKLEVDPSWDGIHDLNKK